jgi:pimeloyl-ACP methyl ester carboxylesterase
MPAPAPPAPPAPAPPPIDAARPSFVPTAFSVEVTGSGRPIILIPGLGCPGGVWKDTVAHFTTAEVHTLSAAGFAGRPPIDRPVISAMRTELAEYIRDRRLERPVVIGHSMGGFLALWLAETEPELVGAVVVVDSGPTLGGGDPTWEPIARRQRDSYRAMTSDAFARTIRQRFSSMFSDPVKYDAIITAVTRSDQRAYADAYFELNTIDLRPELSKITAPVLAIFADLPAGKRYRGHFAPLAKQLQVVVIPRTRHFLMYDAPGAFHRMLDEFIAAHP